MFSKAQGSTGGQTCFPVFFLMHLSLKMIKTRRPEALGLSAAEPNPWCWKLFWYLPDIFLYQCPTVDWHWVINSLKPLIVQKYLDKLKHSKTNSIGQIKNETDLILLPIRCLKGVWADHWLDKLALLAVYLLSYVPLMTLYWMGAII